MSSCHTSERVYITCPRTSFSQKPLACLTHVCQEYIEDTAGNRVSRTKQEAATVAAGTFGGLPLDFEVFLHSLGQNCLFLHIAIIYIQHQRSPSICACCIFRNLVISCFAHQVTEAVRSLRGALLLDGIKAEDGYKLARYNDPFTPPFLRRNEILIRLDNYQLESAE